MNTLHELADIVKLDSQYFPTITINYIDSSLPFPSYKPDILKVGLN